ncbi:MAG: hypothetical protein U9O65_02130 [Thermotogota bacterium]|nr:hypothetical protein [Thermotogota bacterium]
MDITKKLDELEKEIESAKEDKARLEGTIETMTKQLEERFGVTSSKEATDLLKEVKGKIDKVEKELNEKIEELKEDYEW